MLPSFNLHRTDSQAEWLKVPYIKRNFWQRTASNTNGVLTPGNIISLLGLIITATGIMMVAAGDIHALILVVVGRLADIADGYMAHITGTKSPIGEAIDVAVDKILAFLALISFTIAGILTIPLALLILIPNLINIIVSLVSTRRRLQIHPSRDGKIATVLNWLIFIIIPFTLLLKEDGRPSNVLNVIGLLLIAVFVYYSLKSSSNYLRELKHKLQRQVKNG